MSFSRQFHNNLKLFGHFFFLSPYLSIFCTGVFVAVVPGWEKEDAVICLLSFPEDHLEHLTSSNQSRYSSDSSEDCM